MLVRLGRNFVRHVTYLPISPQGRPRFELSYRGNLQQPVEFKIVRTEYNYVPKPPVELGQWSAWIGEKSVQFQCTNTQQEHGNRWIRLTKGR